MKLRGQKLTTTESLLALISDCLTFMLWRNSKHRGAKPKSIYQALTEPPKPKDDLKKFNTSEAFDEWYRDKMERNNG